jgi:hypothetical protein
MESESRGMKYMATNCEGSQSPPRAVKPRKKKKMMLMDIAHSCTEMAIYGSDPDDSCDNHCVDFSIIVMHFTQFAMDTGKLAIIGNVTVSTQPNMKRCVMLLFLQETR